MARNRITGRETQKMQEYTQGQISQAERRGIEFPTDVKEQLFEYANLIGEEEKVRTLVRNLADAVIQADEEGVEDLLDDARMDIQDLPDPTIGKLELRDYGYTAEDMVPLRKEAALDYHRMGSKIYCLGSDGSKGEYASKEMIQAHEGLFGMESQMWERIEENDLDYADEDFGAFQEPMSVIEQEEALKLYDAGADIYLITNFSSPMYVTERTEIERGPEHYQMSMTELERFRNLEWEMQKYPQIQSLKEANLLLGTRRTFGIYQIKDDSPGENYAFMNMRFIESHGMQIKKEDYKLVYVGELSGNMSLDDIFERFNIDRPEDFRGHSYCQKLSELDAKTAEMDKEWYAKRDPKTEEPTKIAKIYVTVYYAEKGEQMLHHFKKSMDIGNGHGGIVSQLKYDNEMKLTDEYWINYQKGKGSEEFQKYMEDLTDMQNHVLPYLQSFCNLEEKGVKERREQQIAERYEGRADERVTSTEANEVVKDVGKTDRKPAQQKQAVDGKDKKLSIHERLEINKRIIQEKQGKDKTERGVDLGVRTV